MKGTAFVFNLAGRLPRNNTHKHVTEECQLKNISGAAIEEPIFNLVEKLITNEYFLNLVSDPEKVAELRKLAERKMFIAKDEEGNLVNPENVPIIVRLARARKMIEMLSSGTYKNKQEIGDMFGMSQAQVS